MNKQEFNELNMQVFGKPKRSLFNDLGNLLFGFIVAVFIIFMLFANVYTGMSVRGPSMMPTYNIDYYTSPEKEDLVYYTHLKDNEYARGDIVIAKANNKDIIKRVIGLPGDKIDIKYDKDNYYVFVNGEKLIEDYILSQKDMVVEYEKFYELFGEEVVVPEDSLFILGDNRAVSNDSTYYGFFKFSSILGRVDYTVRADEIPILSLFVQLFLPVLYND